MLELIRTAADVAGWLFVGLAALIAAETLRLLAGWKVDATVAALRRRLADVEALRSDGVVRAVTFRGKPVEVHTRADFIKVGAFRYSTDLLAEGMRTPDDALARIQPNGDVVEVTIFRVPEIREMLEGGRALGDRLQSVPSMIREHVGDPPYGRPICDETEGDCV